jgi:uncharacterized protein (DUF736 family)
MINREGTIKMDNLTKPTFVQSNSTSQVNNGVAPDNAKFNELVAERRQRVEQGAIWSRTAKSNGMEFLKIRLRFTRKQLQEILARTPENDSEVPITEFVAFPNSNKGDNPNRPSYRVYEAIEPNQ